MVQDATIGVKPSIDWSIAACYLAIVAYVAAFWYGFACLVILAGG